MNRPAIGVIFLTVLLDLVGFGIVLPLIPVFSKSYGAAYVEVGILMAAYSLMQFVFAPIWGRLSDRVGRRPVLLASTAVASLSYGLFAIATHFEGRTALLAILISRLTAGICGANISVAQAYIADISPPTLRTRRMGLIGMAFGLGFILGPSLGALGLEKIGKPGPGYIAAALCSLNFLVTLIFLGESRTATSVPTERRPALGQWRAIMSREGIAPLVYVYFLSTFAFTCFETTLGLLVARNFGIDLESHEAGRMITCLFAYCGIVGAVVQGGLVGRLASRLGEPALIGISLICFAAAMGPIPFLHTKPPLLVALALLAIGSGLTRPPVFGLLSQWTSSAEQGATLGVAQSAGSLARIMGPVAAGALYGFRPALPYLACALLAVVTAGWAWVTLTRAQARIGFH